MSQSAPVQPVASAVDHRQPLSAANLCPRPATVTVSTGDQRIWTVSSSDGQPRQFQKLLLPHAPPRASDLSDLRRPPSRFRPVTSGSGPSPRATAKLVGVKTRLLFTSDRCSVDLDRLFKHDLTLVVVVSVSSACAVTRLLSPVDLGRVFITRRLLGVGIKPRRCRSSRWTSLSLSVQTLQSSHCFHLRLSSSPPLMDQRLVLTFYAFVILQLYRRGFRLCVAVLAFFSLDLPQSAPAQSTAAAVATASDRRNCVSSSWARV
ncbi:hypothetical protein LR48_Vigan07g236500 [Vigna angularis]|uniref:Uncharacterized protein n=1 Tax=Phaseolus angularis TaxID=3914 RepID=A0A0L9V137_PHAAN|nr:hypothetical protein LR48_Vigan07g236500 [Vigna angularis]